MRDCDNVELHDQLPELLHERLPAAERARLLSHVEGCADCAAELALLRDARASVHASAPRVNVDAIARAVAARIAAPNETSPAAPALRVVDGGAARATRVGPPRRASFWSPARLRIAAGIAVMALGGAGVALGRRPASTSVAGVTPVADSPSVVAGSSAGVPTASIESAAPAPRLAASDVEPAATSALGATFSDLSDDELAAVIRAVDSDAGLPAADSTSGARVISSGEEVL